MNRKKREDNTAIAGRDPVIPAALRAFLLAWIRIERIVRKLFLIGQNTDDNCIFLPDNSIKVVLTCPVPRYPLPAGFDPCRSGIFKN